MFRPCRTLAAVVLGAGLVVAHAADPPPVTLELGGLEFQHRWSEGNQHEFTPEGQDDLSRWQDMVTVIVAEGVETPDQLKALAGRVMGNYQRGGRILRAASGARSAEEPVEYLVVALLGNAELVEAVFARMVVIDGAGFVIIRARRGYDADAAEQVGAWVQQHGASVEKTLMAWDGAPSLETLEKLPRSKK